MLFVSAVAQIIRRSPTVMSVFIQLLVLSFSLTDAAYFEKSKWQLIWHHEINTIDEAIKQYFEQRTNVLHVRVHLKYSAPSRPIIMNHLSGVLRNSTQLTYRITIENQTVRSNKYNQHNLWYVDSYDALREILPYKKEHFGNEAGFYVIILETVRKATLHTNIKQILEKMFELNIVDVIVIIHNGDNNFSVYSFEVFSKNDCRKVKPTLVNAFEIGRFRNAELFPYKLRNFHNCTIRVITRNVAPFLKFKPSLMHTRVSAVGIEADILRTIAENLNFQVSFLVKPDYYWGDVFENGTMTGPYKLLENGQVDLLMGYYFYAAHRIIYLEESLNYLSSPVVAVVKQALPCKSRTWVFDPFQRDTWLALLTLIAITVIGLYVGRLRCWYRDKSCCKCTCNANWLDVLGTILGKPRTICTSNSLLRLAIAIWCGGFVILNAAYQGKLFDAYNRVDTNTPQNLSELLNKKYIFLTRDNGELNSWIPDIKVPETHIITVQSNDPNKMYEKLLHSNERMATLSTVLRVLYYMRSRQFYNDFKIVPEIVQLTEACAYFRHHSFLVKPFNKVISKIRSSGLVKKWFSDIFYILQTRERTKANLNQHGNYPKTLDEEKFKVVFVAFIAMQLFACLVFLMESAFIY